ncbi:MAG: DeoR family transcriptional regulator [Candidatus Sungbacteria bacterium]|nr:DeoR family transcriptional regulator [Candidatus Sungbacteria bacterium]
MYESRISKELNRQIFELTLALYRVTDFFPQGEALRKHLREKANEVFGSMSEYGYTVDIERETIAILAKIEAMKGYLELAEEHKFVRPINITVLLREYDAIADFFIGELGAAKQQTRAKEESVAEEKLRRDPLEKKTETVSKIKESAAVQKKSAADAKMAPENGSTALNERQRKIVTHIQETTQAKISDFSTLFGGVSSKTIQRDLQDLVTKNILKKEGEKRWTTYYLNENVL